MYCYKTNDKHIHRICSCLTHPPIRINNSKTQALGNEERFANEQNQKQKNSLKHGNAHTPRARKTMFYFKCFVFCGIFCWLFYSSLEKVYAYLWV